jgi:hypothetical protein
LSKLRSTAIAAVAVDGNKAVICRGFEYTTN